MNNIQDYFNEPKIFLSYAILIFIRISILFIYSFIKTFKRKFPTINIFILPLTFYSAFLSYSIFNDLEPDRIKNEEQGRYAYSDTDSDFDEVLDQKIKDNDFNIRLLSNIYQLKLYLIVTHTFYIISYIAGIFLPCSKLLKLYY